VFASAPFVKVPFSTVGGAVFFTQVDEQAQGADAVSALGVLGATVAETVEALDEMFSIIAAVCFVNEGATGSDAIPTTVQFQVSLIEGAGADAVVLSSVDFVVSLADGAQAQDADSVARALFAAVIAEAGVAQDSVLGRLLWETIQTAQAQNWQEVVTAQLTLQVTVGAGFSAGAISSGPFSGLGGVTSVAPLPDTWQNLNSSQTSAWVLVKTA